VCENGKLSERGGKREGEEEARVVGGKKEKKKE
jgi:hypothetical protein